MNKKPTNDLSRYLWISRIFLLEGKIDRWCWITKLFITSSRSFNLQFENEWIFQQRLQTGWNKQTKKARRQKDV